MAIGPGNLLARGSQGLGIVRGAEALDRALDRPTAPVARGFGPPPKAQLFDTDTGDSITVQFNPTEVERAAQADYRRHRVEGASYQPLQYVQTRNQRITLTLALSSIDGDRAGLDERLRFLESLVYPHEELGSPPVVLFVWPSYLSIEGVIVDWREVTNRFAGDTLEVLGAIVEITFEEARTRVLTSQLVRGGARSAGSRPRPRPPGGGLR